MKSVTANTWLLTGTAALLHFLVDGLCVCCLYLLLSAYGGSALLGSFILYNVLAFLTQPWTGMLADNRRLLPMLLPLAVTRLAVAVVLASVLLAQPSFFTLHSSFFTLIVALPLGFGNSLFHVWGGKMVAVTTGNDPRALGLFVSTGAFGLAVGMVLHTWWALYAFLGLIAILSRRPTPFPSLVGRGRDTSIDNKGVKGNGSPPYKGGAGGRSAWGGSAWLMWGVLLLLMGFVLFRSFLGEMLTNGVAKGGAMALLIGGIAMLGKAFGGWVAKGLGLFITFIIAIVGAVSCMLLKSHEPWLWLPGLLFINGTMAVTLCWANKAMPGREGLSFGLLAAALMPGYILTMAGTELFLMAPLLLLTLVPTIIIELGVLWMLDEHRADVLGSSVIVNILTNIPLNLFLIHVTGPSWPAWVAGELLVILVETLWYRYFVGEWSRAFVYSALCNVISFLIGLLMQLFILLIGNIQ